MNLTLIPFDSQFLRKDSTLSNKLCTHESWISVIYVMLNTPLTEIDGSFARKCYSKFVCDGWTWL